MVNIEFSDKIKSAAPGLRVLAIEATVDNPATADSLWQEIEAEATSIHESYPLEMVNKRSAIAATRQAYKALGKEPNRYRPSAEALCRRVVNGKGLYRLTTLVDFINLISMHTGHSIGGFDADKIQGDTLILDSGNHEDEFHAIGRGLLNIENLPVYRDAIGGIGTPTSDEERTKLTPDTKRLLMLINVYDGNEDINELEKYVVTLFNRHCLPENIEVKVIRIQQTDAH